MQGGESGGNGIGSCEDGGNDSEELDSSSGLANTGKGAVGVGEEYSLSSMPSLPPWGKGSVELRTFSAMNNLIGELEKLT